MSGMPAFSAAGQSQSALPSVRKWRLCSLWKVKRMPSMPGCFFQSGTSALLAGSARLMRPITANRSGCVRAASRARSLRSPSHEGGTMTMRSTFASSISNSSMSRVTG